MVRKNFWTEQEITILREGLSNKERYEDIANKLNRSVVQVRQKAYYFNDGRDVEWSEKDIEYLKSNLNKSDRQIAKELNKTVGTVNYYRIKLRLLKARRWTKLEDKLITDLSVPIRELAERLERSPASIYMRRANLGVSEEGNRGRKWYNGYKIVKKLNETYGKKESYTTREIEMVTG